MPQGFSYGLIAASLAGWLAASLATEAPAERYFQNYWKEKYEEMEEPEVIQDDRPRIDPAKESYLYPGPRSLIMGASVFPGDDDTEAPESDDAKAVASYATASMALESGNPADALRSFEKALENDPDNTFYKLRLARMVMMVNDVSRAESLVEEVLEQEPENWHAMLLMGEIQFNRQRFSKARDWFEKVVEIKPRQIQALQSLTQIAYKVDRDLEKTKELSRRILRINDEEPNAMLWDAEASALTGEMQRSAELFERLIRYRPGLVQQMLEIARRLVAAGRLDNAIVLYESAMLMNPEQDAIRQAWERMLERQESTEAVRGAYERLIEESKNDLKVYELYAEYLRRNQDWEALRDLREEMLDIDPRHLNSLLDLAVYYSQEGDFSKAGPYFQRALDANPADPDTYLMIGEAYLLQGDLEEARPLLEKAMLLAPDDLAVVQTLASIEQQLGNLEKAEKVLRDAMEEHPANGKLLQQLADLYLRQNKPREAAEVYQQVIAAEYSNINAWIQLARIYMEQGNSRALDQLEQEAKDRLGDYPRFHVEYGYLAQQFGQFERSRRALERALRVAPENLQARRTLAQTYLKLGQPEMALETVRKADQYLQGQPDIIEKMDQFRALLLMDMRRFGEAEDILEDLAGDNPEDLQMREQWIRSLVKQGKEQEARKALNNVVRDFGIDRPLEAQLVRARIFMEQGNANRAAGVLRQLLKDHPDHKEVKFQYAMASSEMSDLETAEKYYRQLIESGRQEQDSYYELASNNLGYLFAQKDMRLDEAEKLVRQAHETNPNASYILDSLGWVHFKKGEYEKAREYLERAAKLAISDAEIHSNLGQLYERIGEEELARMSYQRAIELDPTLQRARERMNAIAAGVPSDSGRID